MLPSFSVSRFAMTLLSLFPLVHAKDSLSTDVNAYGVDSQSPYQTFVSAPDLNPPELLITKNSEGLADGYLFIGLDGKPDSTQNVPSIYG